MSNEQRVTLRISDELAVKLQLLVEQSGQTKAAIIRNILSKHLNRLY